MRIGITNVRLDLGGRCQGTDRGAQALHEAGLAGALEALGHQIVMQRDVAQERYPVRSLGNPRLRFLDAISAVCAELADTVEASADAQLFPLVLGGDHSQAIGSIGGLCRHYQAQGKELGVLWVDAHADMNTPETTPTGNIHGMPLAVLLGHGSSSLTGIGSRLPALAAEHVVLFGVRSVDPEEELLVKESGVRVFTIHEIQSRGIVKCLAEALERLEGASAGIHLSYDLDAIDPQVAPGVGVPVPDGLSHADALLISRALAQSGRLTSMELVELNPLMDTGWRTTRLALELICTALDTRTGREHAVSDIGLPLAHTTAR